MVIYFILVNNSVTHKSFGMGIDDKFIRIYSYIFIQRLFK